MRVTILNLTGKAISGGYRKYILNILPFIQADNRVKSLNVFASEQILHSIQNACNPNLINWHELPPVGLISYSKVLKKKVIETHPDVIFIPTPIPLSFDKIPVVTMIQNMEPLEIPFNGNPPSECLKNILRYAATRWACKHARRVISMSKYLRSYLINKWAIEPEKIGVVYHGSENISNSIVPKKPKIFSKIKENVKFIFTAGSIRPARGLEDLIYSLAQWNSDFIPYVIIAGKVEPGMYVYMEKMKKTILKYGLGDLILWAGPLKEDEMAWCFLNCGLFIMTSRSETFGHIGVEALTNGCLCIAADNSCLPEIFENAAIFYQPRNSQELLLRIKDALSWDAKKRKKMSEKAKERAKQFSWEICAQRTVNELKNALI